MQDRESTPDPTEIPPGNSPVSEPAHSQPVQDELKRQYEDLNERYLRLAADYDNFRKRVSREREQLKKFANEQFAIDILDVIDNLERAADADESRLREGLLQILSLCSAVLQRHGITPIDSLSRTFDPAEHEAIAYVPSDKGEGTVIDELAKGYRMHDKVIRFAKVAVSKGNEKR